MNTELTDRLKKATSAFYKNVDNDVTQLLWDLGDMPDWVPFGTVGWDGKSWIKSMYRDDDVGVHMFKMMAGAIVGPHHHLYAETLTYLTGRSLLQIDRSTPFIIDTTNPVFIPSGALHSSIVPSDLGSEYALGIAVLYYNEKR